MSRHHRREKPGKVEMAEAVSAEKVLKHFGWRWAIVYDFGKFTAIEDVRSVKANAEDLAAKLNAERGDGSKFFKVAPIKGVTAQ